MNITLTILLLLSTTQNQNDSVMISLQRTHCYGPCPVYSVTIWGNGRVEFIGYEFVNTIGKKTYSIASKSVDSLVQKIFAMNFFSLNDSYVDVRSLQKRPDGGVDTIITVVSDLPSKYIKVKIGKIEKSVHDYYAGPKTLDELEREIDRIAKTSQWIVKK
jgi:hypothetical protein